MPAIDELKRTVPEVEIAWRAFELRPEPAPLPDAKSEFFVSMWRDSIYPIAESLGVEIKMPTNKPRSRLAHEAAKWADSKDKFEEFKTALFEAYFQDDLDLGKKESLLLIADNLGLKPDELGQALDTSQFTAMVLGEENSAADLGINGVPAFVADRKSGLMGLQTVENLTRLIESVRK